MKCSHCEKPVTNQPRFVEQKGWIKVRKTSTDTGQMRGRRSTGKVLCDQCGETFWHTGRFPSLIGENQTTIEEMLT